MAKKRMEDYLSNAGLKKWERGEFYHNDGKKLHVWIFDGSGNCDWFTRKVVQESVPVIEDFNFGISWCMEELERVLNENQSGEVIIKIDNESSDTVVRLKAYLFELNEKRRSAEIVVNEVNFERGW